MRASSGGQVVLGVSFDYHDAAAAVVVDGRIVAAAEEERFTRAKHEPRLPSNALSWCLGEAGVDAGGLSAIAYYEKPLASLERILSTHAATGPRGTPSLARAMASWSRRKLWVGYRIERALRAAGYDMAPLTFCEHHLSHAAAAFYPSPFEHAAVLTFDAVGEWATSSIAHGRGTEVEMRAEMRFPDSVGLFYSAMTAYCGFAVNDGEFKLMGLAPFGEPRYVEVLADRVIHVHDDGSVRLDQRWFDYRSGRGMTRPRLAALLDGPPRQPHDDITQREADIAASAQRILETAVLRTARHARAITGERAVCLAGGVALNCVANRRLAEEGPFDEVWVQPAAGDAGSALGAALWTFHAHLGHGRDVVAPDAMAGAALGPSFTSASIAAWLTEIGVPFRRPDPAALYGEVAGELASGRIVGWFQGRMEFGPRALGHRSILADPRDPTMVSTLNARIKQREGFRPFGPAVLAEHAADWFVVEGASPYMLFTAAVRPDRIESLPDASSAPAERLAEVRSQIPACTHVDGTARLQTVDRSTAPELHALLSAFHERTGVPVLVNTSFNRRDEPIVRSPADALRCAVAADLDLVVLEGCVVDLRELDDAERRCA